MSRFIYRVCLVAVLLIALAGGVYYYTTVYQKEPVPQKGTFVERTGPEGLQPRQVRPVMRTQTYLAAENASVQAGKSSGKTKEAFVYLSTGKKISAQAVETGKEAGSNGSTGHALFEN